MIRIPMDYDTTRGYDGNSTPQLTCGGHICRIQAVRLEQSRNGREMLVVAFDIAEGGEFDGYFKARHDRARSFSMTAKWPGVFRTTILNAEGRTNGFFKGLIEAVEESNPGYSFKATNGDEQSLRGKLVGFNFGEEEYEPQNSPGEIRTAVKPAYAISVSKVREGVTPPPRKPLSGGSQRPAAAAVESPSFTPVDDDDLPF